MLPSPLVVSLHYTRVVVTSLALDCKIKIAVSVVLTTNVTDTRQFWQVMKGLQCIVQKKKKRNRKSFAKYENVSCVSRGLTFTYF